MSTSAVVKETEKMVSILVAVDGSVEATKALDAAIDMALKGNAAITIVNIVPPLYDYGFNVSYDYGFDASMNSYAQQTGGDVIRKATQRVAEKGLRAETVIGYGDPAEKILEVAKRNKADLILIGFKGLHGLGRLRALGSVSRSLIEKSKIPVMIVPD